MGRQAQNLRGILSLNSPVRNGVIENWDDLETLWDHVWEREEANMTGANGNANQEDYRVLVSVPPLCPPEDWRRLGEVCYYSLNLIELFIKVAIRTILDITGGRWSGRYLPCK